MRQRTKNKLDTIAFTGTIFALVGFLFWFFMTVSRWCNELLRSWHTSWAAKKTERGTMVCQRCRGLLVRETFDDL